MAKAASSAYTLFRRRCRGAAACGEAWAAAAAPRSRSRRTCRSLRVPTELQKSPRADPRGLCDRYRYRHRYRYENMILDVNRGNAYRMAYRYSCMYTVCITSIATCHTSLHFTGVAYGATAPGPEHLETPGKLKGMLRSDQLPETKATIALPPLSMYTCCGAGV